METLIQQEQTMVEQILTLKHLWVILGVYGILALLKYMRPVKAWLFTDKHDWIIAPVNLALSSIGIFVLGLTDFQTINMKIIISIIITVTVTFTHEAAFKHIIKLLENKILAKFKNS